MNNYLPETTQRLGFALNDNPLSNLAFSARFLLGRGADPNGAFGNRTFLTIAAKRGCAETVRVLLRYGADVHGIPGARSPLQWAIAGEHLQVVKVLLAHGATLPDAEREEVRQRGGWISEFLDRVRPNPMAQWETAP